MFPEIFGGDGLKKKIYLAREYTVILILAIFSLVVLIASVNLMNQTAKYEDPPGLFPTVVSAAMLVCCLVTLFRVRKDALPEDKMDDVPKDISAGAWETIRFSAKVEVPFTVFVMIVLTILYGVFLSIAGFYISTAAFLFSSIAFLHRGRIKRTTFVTIGSLIAIYVIMELIFKIKLPGGLL